MGDHQIGVGPLGQMLARGTVLLAVLFRRRSTVGPGRRGRLSEQFGRRRHRRVAGIAVETLTKICNLGPQCGDLGGLGRRHSLQFAQQRDQLVVGRSVRRGIAGRNSQRYARQS
jgi:hypothetical protein